MTKQFRPLWFDPQYRARPPELREAIKNFANHLSDFELSEGLRQRARNDEAREKFFASVEALASNLLLLTLMDDDVALAVPRAHGSMWGKGRYANPVYGEHFLSSIDAMTSVGVLRKVSTGYRYSEKAKALSLVIPTERMAEFLPVPGFSVNLLKRLDEPEVLVLKTGKDANDQSEPIDYKDTRRTNLLRGEIRRLNRKLADAKIEITGAGKALQLGTDGGLIVLHRRSLRRIFNNRSWQDGGRLAGGFWMSMPRAERFERIRLDGERIADVDYQQLYPRLAYVRAGAEQPDGDIYDVAGDGTGRDAWKVLLNAMLFADGGLGNWPKGAREHFPEGTKLRDAIEMLERKHAPIAHLFGTSLGYQLMKTESDMLIAVVSHLFKQRITALPLHDAVLVARSHAETARKAMQDEFTHRTESRRAIVSVDFYTI